MTVYPFQCHSGIWSRIQHAVNQRGRELVIVTVKIFESRRRPDHEPLESLRRGLPKFRIAGSETNGLSD